MLSSDSRSPLFEAEGIQKRFGGVQALVAGSFQLLPGEIHALMGENGAGKSTLGKIIAGVQAANDGSMQLAGEPFAPKNPQEAQQLGVAMIFQELDLFPHLTVAENIVAANLAFAEGCFTRRRSVEAFVSPFLQQVGFARSSRALVRDLTIGEQQLVAIARALSMDARIIVMDESTSALTEEAVQHLFGVIREMQALGVSIVYVSHKMDEIFEICDRITVLRDGKTVGTCETADVSFDDLIRLMVGRPVDRHIHAPSHKSDEVVCEFSQVATHALHDVSFSLHRSEVLGVAGLVGAGRTEIGLALFGVDKLLRGTILLHGKPYTPASPAQAIRGGVGLVPEDRKTLGLMMQMSARENTTLSVLPQLTTYGIISRNRERKIDQEISVSTRRKAADADAPVSHLSGGNQQKVLLGRWLMVDPSVLFLDDPTRGVDVGAKEDIYALIEGVAAAGKSIIMVSSELSELLRCCDRILVMHQGHAVGMVDARATSQEAIMHLAARDPVTMDLGRERAG